MHFNEPRWLSDPGPLVDIFAGKKQIIRKSAEYLLFLQTNVTPILAPKTAQTTRSYVELLYLYTGEAGACSDGSVPFLILNS